MSTMEQSNYIIKPPTWGGNRMKIFVGVLQYVNIKFRRFLK